MEARAHDIPIAEAEITPLRVWGARWPAAREAARVSATVLLLALLVYCTVTAWRVLDDLGAVRLLDLRAALSAVTVRDAVLCLIGWRLAREVARALARRHR